MIGMLVSCDFKKEQYLQHSFNILLEKPFVKRKQKENRTEKV